MSKGTVVPLPGGVPNIGEVYKHYKGDLYKVVGVALNSDNAVNDQWMVVYEPIYDMPAAPLFVRPFSQWADVVEWEGQQVRRFTKVS